MPNTEFHYPLEVKICCFERTREKPVCGSRVPTPSPRFSRDLCGQYHRRWRHSTQSPGVILDLGYECNAIEMTSITCKFDSIPALLKSFNDSTAFGLRHHLFWWAHCWGEDEGYLCLPPHLHLCHPSHTHTHSTLCPVTSLGLPGGACRLCPDAPELLVCRYCVALGLILPASSRLFFSITEMITESLYLLLSTELPWGSKYMNSDKDSCDYDLYSCLFWWQKLLLDETWSFLKILQPWTSSFTMSSSSIADTASPASGSLPLSFSHSSLYS